MEARDREVGYRARPSSLASLQPCGHDIFVDGPQWCADRNMPIDPPMLAIGVRLKCSRCGEQKAHCWGEPCEMDKSDDAC